MRLRSAAAAILLLAVTAVPATAQVGVTVGGLSSNASVQVNGSDVNTDSHLGFQAGVSYATGGVFGVIVGGYYSQKGFDAPSPSTDQVRLAYIEVPVMAVVRLPFLERTIGPRVYGGINGAYEVSCSTEGTELLVSDLCGNTNKFDFGLKGGLGLQVLFIGLDFAYTYGLTDVAKDEALSVNNRAWSLALIIGVG